MGLENLISTLAKTDFKTHTIKPNGKEGVEVVEKSQSLWKGRQFDVNEFDKALDNLLELVRSNPENFETQISESNLYELADKLFEESKSIKSHTKANDVQEKIHKIVGEVLLQSWSHSEETMGDSVTNLGWKKFVTVNLSQKKGDFF